MEEAVGTALGLRGCSVPVVSPSPLGWSSSSFCHQEGHTLEGKLKKAHPSPILLVSVQLLSDVQVFATPWTAARQASLSITNSRSSLTLMSIYSVMLSNHLILCHSLLLLPSVFPSIRVFSNESVLHIIWPKYWRFNFSISPSNEYSGLTSFRSD